MEEFDFSDLPELTAESIVRKLEKVLGIKRTRAPLPLYDFPDELRFAIRDKVEQDISPDLWNAVSYDMLQKRYEDVPDLVEDLIFAYLVKVEYKGDITITYDGVVTENKVWSGYFKKVQDVETAVKMIITHIRDFEGREVDLEDIDVIEVLPNIPLVLWRAYKEGEITKDEVLAEIQTFPEV